MPPGVLFDALATAIRHREPRYSFVRPADDATFFDFEDSMETPPTWPVRISLSGGDHLSATLLVDYDPLVGFGYYSETLNQAVYVLLEQVDSSQRGSRSTDEDRALSRS